MTTRPGDYFFKYHLLFGNAKDALKNIPDNTFHCSVTSPPYWGQRDYKADGQLGQEKTPEEYVDNLIEICREVKRVLREDGTFWINIGDGYCKKNIKSSNIKTSDLLGIPWMVAFALRKDGWYLRSDIIWHKTNPMPESVNNRPSKSYEHLFLLSKSKQYYYDAEAIKEPQKEISIRRAFSKNSVEKRKDFKDNNYAISGESQEKTYANMRERLANGEEMLCNKRDVWTLATADTQLKHFAVYPEALIEPCLMAGASSYGCCPKCKSPWIRKNNKKDWKSNCNCGITEVQECIVLDPFNGSGTTGRVCKRLQLKYVGVDISIPYLLESRESFRGKEVFKLETDTIQELID